MVAYGITMRNYFDRPSAQCGKTGDVNIAESETQSEELNDWI